MRKLIIILGFILGIWWVNSCQAEQFKLPPFNAGAGYSIKDNAPIYLGTFDFANKGAWNLELGYGGRNEESLDEAVAVLSYKIMDNGTLNYPILKYLSFRVGGYVGLGRINSQDLAGAKLDFGPSATAIIQIGF